MSTKKIEIEPGFVFEIFNTENNPMACKKVNHVGCGKGQWITKKDGSWTGPEDGDQFFRCDICNIPIPLKKYRFIEKIRSL